MEIVHVYSYDRKNTGVTAALLWVFVMIAPAARGDTPFLFASPSDDRWHYPFNCCPGTRPTGSTFGSIGDLDLLGNPRFNDRDAELIFAWDTTGQVAPGQGLGAYHVKAVKITITSEGGAEWLADSTADDWFTYDFDNDGFVNADGFPRGDPMDTDGESDDVDPGRPFELVGTGFAVDSIFTEQTWNEESIFIGWNQQVDPVARNPFPFVFQDGTSAKLHVEDNVKGLHNETLGVGRFTPTPWATGKPIGYVPGATPDPFDMEFEVNLSLSCGEVRRHFQEQLDRGRVIVTVTSLFFTTEQAAAGFPSFFLNSPFVLNDHPARLEILFSDFPLGDIDGDNVVDALDAGLFAEILLDPAAATPAQIERADLDADGVADGRDVEPFVQVFLGGC